MAFEIFPVTHKVIKFFKEDLSIEECSGVKRISLVAARALACFVTVIYDLLSSPFRGISCHYSQDNQTITPTDSSRSNLPQELDIFGIEGQQEAEASTRREMLAQDPTLNSFIESFRFQENILEALAAIPRAFFNDKSQTRAKDVFSYVMKTFWGRDVYFPKAGPCEDVENLSGDLDLSIFRRSITRGVQHDIPRSSADRQHVHIYQVASQNNTAEASRRFTPAIAQAMFSSEGDNTQGPFAQRTNPAAFELVTAFLTHLGFNMLEKVLPSAGKTYEEGSSIEHGYLCPTKETIDTLTQEFKDNFSEAEYVCYPSLSREWGEGASEPVYLMLQAAPAIAYSGRIGSPSDELQRYAALANYLAFFRQGIAMAKETGKPVVLHAAAVGGGVFGNTTENLQWGFTKAALALQSEMKANNVSVQLEDYAAGYDRPVAFIGESLKIEEQPRIGDS